MSREQQTANPQQRMIPTDMRLLPPVCYISQPVNRFLQALAKLIWRYPWPVLTLIGFAYLTGIVIVNIPMLEIDSDTAVLVVMSPLIVPLWLMAAYLLPAFLLLTFFARNGKTRLGFSLLFCTMVLVPVLSYLLSDTRLMLIVGDNGFIALFIVLFVGIPWLYFRYEPVLQRYARWSTPALLLLMALFYWEGAIGFSTSHIPPEQYTLTDCRPERPVNKHGVKGAPVWSCRMELTLNGFDYRFPDMHLPDVYLSQEGFQSPKRHLEIRHSLLDHFTLR